MHLRSICCGKNALLFAFLFVVHTASALPMNNPHWTEAGSSTLSGTTATPMVVRVPGDGEVVVLHYEGECDQSVYQPEFHSVQARIISKMGIRESQFRCYSGHGIPRWGPDGSIRFKYYIVPINHEHPWDCPIPENWGEPEGSGRVTLRPNKPMEVTLTPSPIREGEPVLTQTLPGGPGEPASVRTFSGRFGDDEMPVWDQSTKTYRKIQVKDT
ncbi:hypothetical protein F5878DRAFT_80599 [Lentinula raphanica]|uniref:Uncharacterized protein n=1 Tax=Lentinula raphanica TaxID=153919 RepID=A0AA38UGE2_9AGAR|nr:hypothetical protein F5878DRAFT_80599 [Lentinula raphanica]